MRNSLDLSSLHKESRHETPTISSLPKASETNEHVVADTAPQVKNKLPTIIQLKVLKNSQELTDYTQQKIKELINKNEICIPEKKSAYAPIVVMQLIMSLSVHS